MNQCEGDSVLKGLMGDVGPAKWQPAAFCFRQEETRREIILSPGAIKIFGMSLRVQHYSGAIPATREFKKKKSCANETSSPSLQSQED